MGIKAVVDPSLRLAPAARKRLEDLGLSIESDATRAAATGPASDTAAPTEPGPDPASAVALGLASDALFTLAPRPADPRQWSQDGPELLAAATAAAASAVGRPLVAVVLPAVSEPRPGPVAVLSPAGAAAAYELYAAAGLAAASGRRVEHLNGRGHLGSAMHSAEPARAAARASVTDWREQTVGRPERSLHTLATRPAVIVVPVLPGSADAVPVVADHPDADVVLLFDTVQASRGAATARQIGAMVELAIGLELSQGEEAPPVRPQRVTSPVPTAVEGPLPRIRASDVIHVRLTDTAVEFTNRTRQLIRLRAQVGSGSSTAQESAQIEVSLGPDDEQTVSTETMAEVASLASPTATLRHWSHGSAEVYEGGDRRIQQVELTVVDADGAVHAHNRYDTSNGLDFSVTARDLSGLVGRAPQQPALPEPAQPEWTAPRAPAALLRALEFALTVGANALARPAP